MIILAYGQNQYAKKQYLQGVIDRFHQKFDAAGMNEVSFPIGEAKLLLGEVAQAIQTPPFLSEKRLVIIKNLFSEIKKDEISSWLELLKRTPESSIVVVLTDLTVKDMERRTFFKELQKEKNAHFQAFPVLSRDKMGDWVKNQLKRQNIRLSNYQIWQLVDNATDQEMLKNEMDKFIAFSRTVPITEEVFGQLTATQGQDQMFALMDELVGNNPKKALSLLFQQRMSGSHDLQIFSMILRQVKLLRAAKEVQEAPELAKKMQIHPFVARKVMAQSRKIERTKLDALYALARRFDQQIKKGASTPTMAVDRMIFAFS